MQQLVSEEVSIKNDSAYIARQITRSPLTFSCPVLLFEVRKGGSMDIDMFQNICLFAIALVCVYLFKQKERIDVLEGRVEGIMEHCKLDPFDLDGSPQ